MNKHGAIGIRNIQDGDYSVCAGADPGGSGYQTLCGTAVDGDLYEEVEISSNARISCAICKNVWRAALSFKAKDFQ